jgi:hypothetical protein
MVNSTTRDAADIEDDKFPSDPDEVPLIEDQTLFFNEDEDNDEPLKKAHRNAFVKKCYGEPNEEDEWTAPRTGKVFTLRRYKEYIHLIQSWTPGPKQVYMKFRRTQPNKQIAYSVIKNFDIKRVNSVNGKQELLLIRKDNERNRGGLV